MAKQMGATDAFNAIVQKIDEALIQAESHFRGLCPDTESTKVSSAPDTTVLHIPQSERSCSPIAPRAPPSSAFFAPSSRSSSGSSVHLNVKSKSYVTLDKKKAVVMTSFKSNVPIADAEVNKVQKLIENLFGKKTSSTSSISTSSASSVQF
ncbi:unnamed protein product [Caenorhabditis sp. 36 PRJEB53466]|nr:unnamed protein product [Caenorhabditis sp. 36 PRJEB53466]